MRVSLMYAQAYFRSVFYLPLHAGLPLTHIFPGNVPLDVEKREASAAD
jgi:hypothetical protein